MSYNLRRNLKLVAVVVLSGMTIGIVMSSFQQMKDGGLTLSAVWNGSIDGGLISLLLSAYTLLFVGIFARNTMRRLNFTVVLMLNSAAYVGLILGGRAIGRWLAGETTSPVFLPADSASFNEAMVVAGFAALGINFLFENSRLLGPAVLANFITGRYHQPQNETRIVLFLDLAGSTTIAEQLGNRRYISFLDAFFFDLSEAILESRAEIYKYVGDEIILSWRPAEGLRDARCARFYLRVLDRFQALQPRYEREFGCSPRFRAALHMGEIAVGEVGHLKKEIALIGDVVNSTARLLEVAREVGVGCVLSADVRERLELPPELRARSLGERTLRGRQAAFEVFALEDAR